MQNKTPKEALLKNDFRLFLVNGFLEIGLPYPDPVQLDIAHELQHTTGDFMFQAFRTLGKSVIVCFYVAWLLYRNPSTSIFTASASGALAKEMSRFVRHDIIGSIPWLKHLAPKGEDCLDTVIEFNVNGKGPGKDPSMKARGVGQQWTGSHFDIAIVDDIEIPQNSMTQEQRDKLWQAYQQLDHMRNKPHGRIITIGTPQCEDSIYERIKNQAGGVRSCIWPVQIPEADKLNYYGDSLGPIVQKMITEGGEPGDLVCPERFNEEVVAKAQRIRSEFMLQYMLDTSLSDEDRHPLKLRDLVVLDCDNEMAPPRVIWSNEPQQKINDAPNVGLRGDSMYYGKTTTNDWSPYNKGIMAIDPSGTGKDETGYVIIKELGGYLYLLDAGGLQGGYKDSNLQFLADKAKEYRVNKVVIESNFGDGMWTHMFSPVLRKTLGYSCAIDEVKVSTTKEFRICDVLEPVLGNHRLVVNKALFTKDKKSTDKYKVDSSIRYSLFFQMTRIAREKKCLAHDDRLDALALGVGCFTGIFAVSDQIHQSRVKDPHWLNSKEHQEWFQKMKKDSEESLSATRRTKSPKGFMSPPKKNPWL